MESLFRSLRIALSILTARILFYKRTNTNYTDSHYKPPSSKGIFFAFSFLLFTCCLYGQDLVVERLNDQINSGYDEISPVISVDGKTLYFTRMGHPDFDKTLVEKGSNLAYELDDQSYDQYLKRIYTMIGEHSYVGTSESKFNQDVWIAKSLFGEFDQIIHPSYPLNNALPNSVCAITPSNNEVIVINQFEQEGGMTKGFSISRQMSDGTWTFPDPIDIDQYYNTHPDVSTTMSFDGNVMILSMQMHDSHGQNDLYVSFRTGSNSWSKPKNLGTGINSSGRETTPFITEDNKMLFFASNRQGRSGSDIFVAKRLDDSWQNWGTPERMLDPINSDSDDSKPYFNSATGYLYFSSKRNGSSDIFRVKLSPPNPITVTIKGKILNRKTEEPVSGKILTGYGMYDQFSNVYISDDGSYRMSVPKGVTFKLIPEKEGFRGFEEQITFKKSYVYYKEYEVNLWVEPIEVGTKIELDPIYFKRSKPIILKKSYPVLNRLANYMKENPRHSIIIEGHTDNQGDPGDLKALSQARADAIKEYLVYKKRMNPVKIETAGYGATRPVNDNENEKQRAKNRRVEVSISGISSFGG